MTNRAALYRMVMDDHLCPYGLKSKDLLERQGYELEGHHLTRRTEVNAFMAEHGVDCSQDQPKAFASRFSWS